MILDRMTTSKRGSVYIFVLLVVLLTSVLGVSLLSFAYNNLRVAGMFFQSNSIYYKTEASIATVLAEIERQTRIGQEKAKEQTEANRALFIEMATSYNEETGLSYFDEEYFKEVYEEYFCNQFNQYMCEDRQENGKKVILSLRDTVPGILSIDMPDYDADLQENPRQDLIVTVEAQKEEKGALKNIIASFKILREAEISIKKVVAKYRNPIWMRAVTAEGDVIATGGKVTISSYDDEDPNLDEQTVNLLKKADAVYAWGTNYSRNAGSNQTGDHYGGIIAGVNQRIIDNLNLANKFGLSSEGGNLHIIGETVTDAYIHTFGSNSSILIDIKNSKEESLTALGTDLSIPKVIADSVQTEEFLSGNQIMVNGDVMVKDDLELNGNANHINITGSFLGISSGPDIDFSNDKYANRSSSISYNDASQTSTLNIGKYVVVSGVAYNTDVTYQLDPYKDTPYKTGESLAIGENHKVYRYYFEGEDINQSFDNGFKLKINGTMFDYPLFSGKTAGNAPPNSVGNNRISRFKEYLINKGLDNYLDYSPELAKDIIKIGTENGNRVEGYSLGVLPVNGSLYFPLSLTAQDRESNPFLTGMLKIFDWIFASDEFNLLKDFWNKRYHNETWLAGKKDTRKLSPEFASLVDESINYNVDKTSEDGKIVLISSSGDLNIDFSALDNKGGLIFAKGNVIIRGSGSFKGSVVAGGSVVFKGSGAKKISYHEQNVLRAIRLDDKVKAALSKGGISEIIPDSVEIELKAQRNVITEDYREQK